MAALARAPDLPGTNWVSGYMGAFGRDPLGMFEACARAGDAVQLRFGLGQLVLLSHPDLIEQVLVSQQQHFRRSEGTRRLRSVIGDGLLTTDGPTWLRHRRLTQPAFHRARINAFAELMVDYADRLIDTWRDGETRDIHQEMAELTLQIACSTLFGVDVSGDVALVREATAVLGSHFQSRFSSLLFLLPDTFPTPGNMRYQAAVRSLDRLVSRIIDQRRRQPLDLDTRDVLSMLLQARDAEDASGARLSDREVRDEVMTFLLAGHETTALTLAWTCYLLDQHPQAAERLRHEVWHAFGGRRPTLADLPRLPYLDAVISESLRLYPPAYTLGRHALRDVTIGGYPIRRGSTVLMSPWVVHRDGRYFDDPYAFRPERWLDGRLARELPQFAYFPFGGGPHQCIGVSFALLESHLVLAILLQRVRLRLVAGHPVEPLAVVTIRPRYGMHMQVGMEAAQVA